MIYAYYLQYHQVYYQYCDTISKPWNNPIVEYIKYNLTFKKSIFNEWNTKNQWNIKTKNRN